MGAAVASHWLLDLVVHVPDLPLVGNDSPKLGLGLWRHFELSVALELRGAGRGCDDLRAPGAPAATPCAPRDCGLLLALLVGMYAASIFGPPPPSITAIGLGDVGFLLLMGLVAAWADQGRDARRACRPAVEVIAWTGSSSAWGPPRRSCPSPPERSALTP